MLTLNDVKIIMKNRKQHGSLTSSPCDACTFYYNRRIIGSQSTVYCYSIPFMMVLMMMLMQANGFSTFNTIMIQQRHHHHHHHKSSNQKSILLVLLTSTTTSRSSSSSSSSIGNNNNNETITITASSTSFEDRQEMYDEMRMRAASSSTKSGTSRSPSIWSFEALFPSPLWDEEIIRKDLYELTELQKQILSIRQPTTPIIEKSTNNVLEIIDSHDGVFIDKDDEEIDTNPIAVIVDNTTTTTTTGSKTNNTSSNNISYIYNVDVELSRRVKDRVYGMRTASTTTTSSSTKIQPAYEFDTSLIDASRAVQFAPDGKRIGRPLKVNIDTLTYAAKRALRKHNRKEAEMLYRRAMEMDPHDGRPYLGLSKCAQQRQDLISARNYLKMGLRNAVYDNNNSINAGNKNPFLLQALGTLEEKVGHLAEAERLYVAAVNSQPSHAAAWVALAQLRTEKLRQSVQAGRVCYENAERELAIGGLPPSSYVYAAWAALEWKKADDVKLARTLFEKAITIDPKCSAAFLQLGVMEADKRNWEKAEECFETVLKFDNRNSRVLQAYAIMESKRPDGDSRTAIGLFERALKVNSKDAGVYQAYGLYVASLGDMDAAIDLLRRGTVADKKHAPVWQAWGVLESRHGSVVAARDIFQQGIWACAQSSGGQSGGRHCARLWQAWGLLEEREGEYAAARRCFSRAMDADSRNVAAITAWTLMEEALGNVRDARAIYERALKQFTSPASEDNMALWRAYELMESRAGNVKGAALVYQRYTRASFAEATPNVYPTMNLNETVAFNTTGGVEVIEWSKKQTLKKTSSAMESEVWMNNGAVEGKIPVAQMRKFSKNSNRNS